VTPPPPPSPLGKPNAALTVLDFAVRHGVLDSDYEHYIEVSFPPFPSSIKLT